jgi:hypothetical protein
MAVAIFGALFCPSIGMGAQDGGYDVGSDLWLKAILQVPGNPVTLIWKLVGTSTTPSGDTVISGYFYANPGDFAYGNMYNPEAFVKIYIATSGWANIAFNHVTVDPVSVYSAHHYSGSAQQSGQITLGTRLAEHTYTGVGGTAQNFDGSYSGTAMPTTDYDYGGDPCGDATMSFTVSNYHISGKAVDSSGQQYTLSGEVASDGTITAGLAVGGSNGATFSGKVSGNTATGTWQDVWGCGGTWSVARK